MKKRIKEGTTCHYCGDLLVFGKSVFCCKDIPPLVHKNGGGIWEQKCQKCGWSTTQEERVTECPVCHSKDIYDDHAAISHEDYKRMQNEIRERLISMS